MHVKAVFDTIYQLTMQNVVKSADQYKLNIELLKQADNAAFIILFGPLDVVDIIALQYFFSYRMVANSIYEHRNH